MNIFSVREVSLRFGGVQAVGNVSFDVEQGEVFAIIGPNGAGKTSMLNVITRVFDPTSGSVVFDGQDITALARHRVVQQGIARTFTSNFLKAARCSTTCCWADTVLGTAASRRSGCGHLPCAARRKPPARRWKR